MENRPETAKLCSFGIPGTIFTGNTDLCRALLKFIPKNRIAVLQDILFVRFVIVLVASENHDLYKIEFW